MRYAISILILWLAVVPIRVQADENSPKRTSYSSRGASDSWTVSSRYTNIVGFGNRPDKAGFLPYRVVWRPVKVDPLGRTAQVTGTLQVQKEGTFVPVDWFQGGSIYSAMIADDQPDWSNGMDRKNTTHETCTLLRNGDFSVELHLSETNWDVDKGGEFQVAVALAEHRVIADGNEYIIWKSATPVIRNTTTFLTFPPRPPLAEQLELIHKASSWPDGTSVELIRAVNSLQRGGKKEAIRWLREYARLTAGDNETQQVIAWIVQLLFEPAQPGTQHPFPSTWHHSIVLDSDNNVELTRVEWPRDPLALAHDVPFMVGQSFGGFSGPPPRPSEHIDWAQRHGIIRTRPLHPTLNPMEAADNLLRSRRFKRAEIAEGKWPQMRASICNQALIAIGDSQPIDSRNQQTMMADWQLRMKEVARRNLKWDAERQDFVSLSPDEP